MIAEAIPTTEGPTWAFWVTAICVPMMFVAIGSIIWRLRRGEEKFDKQGESLATLSAHVEELRKTCDELRRELAASNRRMSDGSVEHAGDFGELKAAIAREYARRDEFDAERLRSDERFMQMVNLIGESRAA